MNRRSFVKSSIMGGFAATFFNPVYSAGYFDGKEINTSTVAITTGNDRADLTFRALKPFSEQIRRDIGNKTVVIKPNNVAVNIQLASTHVETLEGILEFLKSIKKTGNVIIAESAANGPTFDGFSNFGYTKLLDRYPVKLKDLDHEKYEVIYVFDEKDFRPHPVRVSAMLLSRDTYTISAAKLKTHDRAVVTLSLKNIVFGAPIKDDGYTFGRDRREGSKSDKPVVHGSGFRGINFNLYDLAPKLHPDFAVIDGFEGMEGNGPSTVNAREKANSSDFTTGGVSPLNVMLYPNPNTGNFRVRLKGLPADKIELNIIDINGRCLYKSAVSGFTGEHTGIIQTDIPQGTYILEVKSDKTDLRTQFIIDKSASL